MSKSTHVSRDSRSRFRRDFSFSASPASATARSTYSSAEAQINSGTPAECRRLPQTREAKEWPVNVKTGTDIYSASFAVVWAAVGERIEKQIGEGRTRARWSGVREVLREDDSAHRRYLGAGVFTQALVGAVDAAEEPEDTAGDEREDGEPAVKGLAGEFVRAVEAAEDDGVFGKAGVLSRRCLGHRAMTIARLIARQGAGFFRCSRVRDRAE